MMTVKGLPRILLCAFEPSTLDEMRQLLAGSSCQTTCHLLGSADPEQPNSYQLIVVEGNPLQATLEQCRRLRERLSPLYVPVLFLSSEGSSAARIAALEAGVDACLIRPYAAGELFVQIKALLRSKDAYDRLAGKSAEIHRLNKCLQQLHQQIDYELQLAQRIQSSLLPRSLPDVPQSRFAVHYMLRDRVGGDFYDVFRLDEHHVALYVADAMGHGVPASLLTIFVKKGVVAKEVFGNKYRLVPPEEVLQRLNKDLVDQHLSEHSFLTMAYALYNHRDGIFRFARAGHPYPLYVPQGGEPVFLRQEGLLLGVVDAAFPARNYPLKPGDKVLLYSDGIDTGRFEDHSPGTESLLACATRHRQMPIQQFIDCLVRDLFRTGEQPDDLTLLGLEVVP